MPPRHDIQGGLFSYLDSRGLDAELAIENGWYMSDQAGDRFARLVIPCTNSRGRCYWQARAVDPAVEKRYQSPPYAAEDSIVLVWPKEVGKTVVVVEGPFDALAAAELGHVGVAVMGNRPSNAVISNIVTTLPGYQFIVVPDLDSVPAGGFIAAKIALKGRPVLVKIPVGAKDLSRMPKLVRERLLSA